MSELKIIIHDAEEGGYWAEVQGMPGCYSQGETLAEVRANIREAAEGWAAAKLALALRSPVRDRAAHRGRGASPRCSVARRGRKDLDPPFYPDLATFRAAVADGTVDVAKGCRNMAEYHQSMEGAL